MARFIAKLHRNSRNTNRLDQKVLLTGVHNEDTDEQFRDHCWVPLTAQLKRLLPSTNRTTKIVTFEAVSEPYPYDHSKSKLAKIKNIQVVG